MGVIGIGIATARYGHVGSFVREDRNPAAPPLEIRENSQGYEKLKRRLESLAKANRGDQLLVRIDAAGQYAANLSAAYGLTLLAKYPTAAKVAGARLSSLKSIPYMKSELAEKLHATAKESMTRLTAGFCSSVIP